MRLTIAYSKIKKRNLVINNATNKRETLSEWPVRQPLSHVYDQLLQQQRTVHSADSKKYASRGSEAAESAHYWGSPPSEDESVLTSE